MYDSPSSRFVIPSAALDLSCRRENSTYEEVRHSKSYKVRCLPLPLLLLSDRCARKISRFARNDNTGKAVLSFSTYLRRIFPRGKDFRTLPPSYGRRCPVGAEVGWGSVMKKSGGRSSQVSHEESTRAPLRGPPSPIGKAKRRRLHRKKEANPASLRSAAPSKGRGLRGHSLLPMEGGAPKGRRLERFLV